MYLHFSNFPLSTSYTSPGSARYSTLCQLRRSNDGAILFRAIVESKPPFQARAGKRRLIAQATAMKSCLKERQLRTAFRLRNCSRNLLAVRGGHVFLWKCDHVVHLEPRHEHSLRTCTSVTSP